MDKFFRFFQHRLVTQLAAIASLLALSACGDAVEDAIETGPPVERPEGRFTLIEQTDWQFAESDDDPFTDRPEQVRCPTSSWGVEELGGETTIAVSTDFCDYFTVMQGSGAAVFAGDTLHYRIFHFGLESRNPAKAHVALRIGSDTLVDELIDIPSESNLIAGAVPVDVDLAEGTPIYFHVHNHGANEYSLIELSAEAP